MFKTSKDFEQGVVKLLTGIVDSKVEFSDFKGVINDLIEFKDVAQFAADHNLILDIDVNFNNSMFKFEPKTTPTAKPRLSYHGLKFLENHQED